MNMIKLNGCFLSGCEYTSHITTTPCVGACTEVQETCGISFLTKALRNIVGSIIHSFSLTCFVLWCDANGFCVKGIILKYSINLEKSSGGSIFASSYSSFLLFCWWRFKSRNSKLRHVMKKRTNCWRNKNRVQERDEAECLTVAPSNSTMFAMFSVESFNAFERFRLEIEAE